MLASRGVGEYQASEAHQWIAGRGYRPSDGQRGVLWSGGSGNTDRTFIDTVAGTFPLAEISRLAAERYPVISHRAGTDWGNAAAITRWGNLWTFAPGRTGMSATDFFLIAVSMGTPNALNWVRSNASKCKAAVLITPAVDVEDIRANDRGSHQANIHAAYTDNATWQAARPTHNPTEYAAADLQTIPFLIFKSADDPTCTEATVDAFAAKVTSTVVSLGAIGHSSVGVNPQTIVDFFAAHA